MTVDSRKRYAQVGLGGRSAMFTDAIVDNYSEMCRIVALCDVNQGRMDLVNSKMQPKHPAVPTYKDTDFDRMIAETKPHCVIVTTIDAMHSKYIQRAMELGCDVITEKPMTIDERAAGKSSKPPTRQNNSSGLRLTIAIRRLVRRSKSLSSRGQSEMC